MKMIPNTIGRTGVSPQDFNQVIAGLAARQAANKEQIRALQNQAWDIMDAAPPSRLKTALIEAEQKRAGVDKAFHALLAEVAPVKLHELRQLYDEDVALAGAVKSFKALCDSLQSVELGPEQSPVKAATGRREYAARDKLLKDLRAVRTALEAAGEGVREVGLFPKKQLDQIEDRARTDAKILADAARASVAGLPEGRVLTAKDLPTIAAAADTIGKLTNDPALAASLVAAAERVKPAERAEFQANLTALAVLGDVARTAPDYSTTRMSWSYPDSRLAYRLRQFEAWDLWASESRRESTEARLALAGKAVAGGADPAKVLEEKLTDAFLREVGVPPATSGEWNVTAKGVRAALEHEALLPLRALNELVDDVTARRDARPFAKDIEQVVTDVTRHVLEGDYREWRYSTPKSDRQLAVLSQRQKDQWKEGLETESPSAAGGKLKTREEDGVELLWVTKIGGPSHGFDYGPNCLLPLLANGRTKAILVDDERWPHNAAARCYLRVLSREDGAALLYLEPFQRDFPHGQKVGGRDDDAALRLAQVGHALEKAKEMGVPLSLPSNDSFLLEYLGVPFKRDERAVVIEASAGVFEASDTLFPGHDFPQVERMVSKPMGRILVDPKDLPKE